MRGRISDISLDCLIISEKRRVESESKDNDYTQWLTNEYTKFLAIDFSWI